MSSPGIFRFNARMYRLVPLFIGLRYTRAKRRNQFISFVNGFSLFGMALGVLALIIVLSVMNGFDREVKNRILSVVPHASIDRKPHLNNWRVLAQKVAAHPQVLATAPYISGYGLIAYNYGVQGVQVQGVLPAEEKNVSVIEQHMRVGSIDDLRPGEYGIVLGALLARYLGVSRGDKVTLTLPDITITPAGVFPRSKRFTVVGVFEVGAQVDQSLVMIHLRDAQKLYRYSEGVQGIHLKVTDIYLAGAVVASLSKQLGDSYLSRDWSQTQGSLFQAVKMEKTVITVLLMIIIAVAAFNIITSLVLMVADKRSDIAVLRTLGLSARQVMAIFIIQGCAVGILGIAIGAVLGTFGAIYIGAIVHWFEQALGLSMFDPRVYFISQLPSQWRWSDTLLICTTALVISALATLYPAYRAAKVEPAEALRYE